MLIEESHQDVPTNADGKGTMRTKPRVHPFFHRSSNNTQQASSSSIPKSQTIPKPAFPALSSFRKSIKIHGKSDGHVPPEGRDLIRKTLHEKGVCFSFYEIAWAQREWRGGD
ncbi:MAG: hypothetical protein Q9225_003842 [Loekoesia sp. 1 TL-2023]